MARVSPDTPGRIAREARLVLLGALGDDAEILKLWASDAGLSESWLQSVDWSGSVQQVTLRVVTALSRCPGPQVATYLRLAADEAYGDTQQQLRLLAHRAAALPDEPVLHDAIPEEPSLWGWLRLHPRGVMSSLFAGVLVMIVVMGLLVHQRRVGMLGLQWDQLSWQPDQAALAGAMAMLSQLLYAPAALLSWGPLSIGPMALALVGLAVLLVVAAKKLPLSWLLRLHLLLLPVLLLGGLTLARVVTHPGIRAPASQVERSYSVHYSSRFPAAAVATAATWLENDRDGERRALAGLCGWFLLVAGAGIVTLARREVDSLRLRRRVVLALGGYLVLGVVVSLFAVPAAYAYARWGISYPQVTSISSCSESWSEALADAGCGAWDISGGSGQALFYATSGCPMGPWWRPEAGCAVALGPREVVQRKLLVAAP